MDSFSNQRGWERFLGHEIGIFPACALCGFRVRLPHRRNAAWRRPLKLQPQPARLLALLIQRAGETVTREELAREVWGADTFVDFEQGLNYAIRQIRTVLKDDADNPRFLETQHKRGYQFIAPLERVAVPSETLLPAPAQSLPTRRREVLQLDWVCLQGRELNCGCSFSCTSIAKQTARRGDNPRHHIVGRAAA